MCIVTVAIPDMGSGQARLCPSQLQLPIPLSSLMSHEPQSGFEMRTDLVYVCGHTF
jgi:hypothetical protein